MPCVCCPGAGDGLAGLCRLGSGAAGARERRSGTPGAVAVDEGSGGDRLAAFGHSVEDAPMAMEEVSSDPYGISNLTGLCCPANPEVGCCVQVNLDTFDAAVSFVNVNNNHWRFVYLHVPSRSLFVMDPAAAEQDLHLSTTAVQCYNRYFRMRQNLYGKQVWGSLKWKAATIPHTVQQDTTSCGVFVMQKLLHAEKDYCSMCGLKEVPRDKDIEAVVIDWLEDTTSMISQKLFEVWTHQTTAHFSTLCQSISDELGPEKPTALQQKPICSRMSPAVRQMIWSTAHA
ncbi:hypothetical protein JOQ06_026742, partial [Pogonophryne albipinna]